MTLFQRFAVRFLGWEYVWLEDFDGEFNLRRTRGGGPRGLRTCRRFNLLPSSSCVLNADGSVGGPCYVKKWHPVTGEG